MLDKWWKVERFRLSDTDKSKSELLVKTFNNHPRLLEVAGRFLERHLHNDKQPYESTISRIDDALIHSLTTDLMEYLLNLYGVFNSKYIISDSKHSKYLYALMFSERLNMDQKCMQLIRYSIFTNSLVHVFEGSYFPPEASMMMLAALSSSDPRTPVA